MKRCKQQKWNFGSCSNLVKFWCLLFLYIAAAFFDYFFCLLVSLTNKMYHLTAGVKAALGGLLVPALDWSRTEAEELPVPCRQEELIPVVTPSPSPHGSFQTAQNYATAGVTTGTDITELAIHHLWHRSYFRKYCFGTFRNNHIKVGAVLCFTGRSCRQ